jgi:outer membrane protein assembly factor BamB
VAVNPADGTDRWTLPLNGYMFSAPVLAPDGNIFLTDSEPGTMFDWSSGTWVPGTRGNAGQKSRLFVIAATPASAGIVAQVEIDVDLLSVPAIASDGAGGYLVYVNTFDMGQPGAMMFGGNPGVDRYLYAFLPDGTLKFKVALGQMSWGFNNQGQKTGSPAAIAPR